MRKVCVVTGTRAEYGIMQNLIKLLHEDPEVELQLLVTGMHLSPEFGNTIETIIADGFPISKKVEVLLSSDTPIGISKTMGLGMISFAEALEELAPDIMVVLGDRFEIFSAVAAAMIARIPVGHIHGGEATEGLIDEPIRHSITKMSHVHFPATEEYRNRIIQLGEQPERVFCTGTPGLDNILSLDLLSKEEFEKSIEFDLEDSPTALLTFHPVTLDFSSAEEQFGEILAALSARSEMKIIFTMPNSDTDGRVIIKMINHFVAKNPKRYKAFISLGQLRYLSALKHVHLVIGNSSSGLIEVPSFKIPTINIGDRQKGRIKAASVINCEPTESSITEALDQAFDIDFKASLQTLENPYGEAGASKKIKDILCEFNLENIIKKNFYDL